QGQEAVNNLIHEAEREHYAESYIADLYKLLGESEDGLGNHQDAYDAYLTSLELNSSELTRVFLARSACNNGECAETRQLLESIDDSLLDESERFDLAIVWALMAATSLVVGDISEAKTRLKAIEAHDPFFIQLRDQWMIALLEAKPKSESGKIRNLILSLNKYVILNPNLFGIGLNINRIIDDAESSPHNKDG
ncbi:hypothetical protein KA005_26875, partial [bacterium]|nr:hypothetical protein [bacterium]